MGRWRELRTCGSVRRDLLVAVLQIMNDDASSSNSGVEGWEDRSAIGCETIRTSFLRMSTCIDSQRRGGLTGDVFTVIRADVPECCVHCSVDLKRDLRISAVGKC